ncbi:MAG: 3-dehydroquinate synthase [Pyrinomonadaceae bacterium]
MNPQTLRIELTGQPTAYEIVIGHDLLATSGKWARKCLGNGAGKIVVISNPTVFKLYGSTVCDSLCESGFAVTNFLMKDGEQHKSLKTAEQALKLISESGLTRTDAIVALGGGVVGDMAGFASAIYLRGLAFLQIPTTLLSMIDSSVGGKTGVNSPFGKNLIGSFHQPSGVLIDPAVLKTLPLREITAGLCEMVKHGAIAGKPLLTQTQNLLANFPVKTFAENQENENFRSEISNLIAANVAFKAKIVAGDERESSGRVDGKSRKILNFGHTLAHALEKVTNYRYFKHGEAVGYGILFAAELSKSLALYDEKDVKLLNDVVQSVGSLPPLANIDGDKVFEAFKFDKKHLSGSLQMILLKGIGKPVILTEKDIPRRTVQKVLKKLLQKWA